MQLSRHLKKIKYCFLLVLLLHFFGLLGFSIIILPFEEAQKKPEADAETKADRILPAYVYHDTASAQPTQTSAAAATTDPDGILKPKTAPTKATDSQQDNASSSTDPALSGASQTGPANLIADNPTDKPLIKLLSRAAGAKLLYPKVAQDFRITGTVHISFKLAPNGVVSEVTLLQSSGSKQLDRAAMAAIIGMSPVHGVDAYVSSPRVLTVGVIFAG